MALWLDKDTKPLYLTERISKQWIALTKTNPPFSGDGHNSSSNANRDKPLKPTPLRLDQIAQPWEPASEVPNSSNTRQSQDITSSPYPSVEQQVLQLQEYYDTRRQDIPYPSVEQQVDDLNRANNRSTPVEFATSVRGQYDRLIRQGMTSEQAFQRTYGQLNAYERQQYMIGLAALGHQHGQQPPEQTLDQQSGQNYGYTSDNDKEIVQSSYKSQIEKDSNKGKRKRNADGNKARDLPPTPQATKALRKMKDLIDKNDQNAIDDEASYFENKQIAYLYKTSTDHPEYKQAIINIKALVNKYVPIEAVGQSKAEKNLHGKGCRRLDAGNVPLEDLMRYKFLRNAKKKQYRVQRYLTNLFEKAGHFDEKYVTSKRYAIGRLQRNPEHKTIYDKGQKLFNSQNLFEEVFNKVVQHDDGDGLIAEYEQTIKEHQKTIKEYDELIQKYINNSELEIISPADTNIGAFHEEVESDASGDHSQAPLESQVFQVLGHEYSPGNHQSLLSELNLTAITGRHQQHIMNSAEMTNQDWSAFLNLTRYAQTARAARENHAIQPQEKQIAYQKFLDAWNIVKEKQDNLHQAVNDYYDNGEGSSKR